VKKLATSNRAIVVLVYLLAVIIGLLIVLYNMKVSSDMSAFLPAGATQQQKIIFTQYKQAANSRAVMIGIEGSDQVQLIIINKKISRQLKQSGLFSVVNNGQSALPARAAGILFNNRFALNGAGGAETYTTASLRLHLQKRLADLSSAISPIIKKTLPRDPAGEFESVLSSLKNGISIKKISGVFFSSTGDTCRPGNES
jgi:predicted exporter